MATTKNTYTGNGSTTDYSFTFPYIKQADVKVNVDNVATTAFTFANATTVSFNTAPANSTVIDIYRSTDDSNLVATFYPGSAIRSADLNDNYTQNLYSTQENTNDATEALDNSRVLEDGAYVSAITKASEAVTTANTADGIADAAKLATDTYVHDGTELKGDGVGSNPKGVAYAVSQSDQAYLNSVYELDENGDPAPMDGADDQSAVKFANFAMNYAEVALDNSQEAHDTSPPTFTSAIDRATSAETTANSATTTANGAVTTANAATTTANGAVTTANTASTNATNAVNTANTASTNADTALDNSRKANGTSPETYTSAIDVADAADAIADDAADDVKRWIKDGDGTDTEGDEDDADFTQRPLKPQGVPYAVTQAEAAVSTANTASANATAAQTAVSNAELFTPYATKSDIPNNNISSITVTSGGSVYQTVPAVTITNTSGTDGSGATATAVLTDGVVTSITVNTKGNNYNNGATVAIAASTGTDGTDATATAVLGPLNADKAEVSDSTGLESFTPLTGKPAGFILGDDGLTVKLKYNSSTPTWEWVSYYSNDPETRYRKKIIIENKITIDEDYAVGVGNNGFSVGPVSIDENKTLTIPNNSTYLVL